VGSVVFRREKEPEERVERSNYRSPLRTDARAVGETTRMVREEAALSARTTRPRRPPAYSRHEEIRFSWPSAWRIAVWTSVRWALSGSVGGCAASSDEKTECTIGGCA